MFPLSNGLANADLDERRGSFRSTLPCRATIRGVDRAGVAFRVEARIDNLSTTGLYVRIPCNLTEGGQLLCILCFPRDAVTRLPGARLAVRGRVCRVEPQSDGYCGVAVVFERQHFLPAGPR